MHTSGISVDETVQSQFADAQHSSNKLFLKYRIAGDRFVKEAEGDRTGSRVTDFTSLQQHMPDREPAFFLVRPTPHVDAVSTSTHYNKWVLLFYMPESAAVRDRMIYSSSSSALRDGLGSGNFVPGNFNVLSASECTEEAYDDTYKQWKEEEIMTWEERQAKEAETSSHLARGSTKVNAIVGLPIQAGEQVVPTIESCIQGTVTAVILQLSHDDETLIVEDSGVWTFEDVAKRLPTGEPRYVFFHFAHERDGNTERAFIFYYCCPDAIKPKLKMFYSTCKSVVVKLVESLGCTIARSLEISDRQEMTTAAVLADLYQSVQQKKTFSKPTRPGKGKARLIGASFQPSAASSSAAAAASTSSPSPTSGDAADADAAE